MQFLSDLYQDEIAAPVTDFADPNAGFNRFLSGKVAMHTNGPWQIVNVRGEREVRLRRRAHPGRARRAASPGRRARVRRLERDGERRRRVQRHLRHHGRGVAQEPDRGRPRLPRAPVRGADLRGREAAGATPTSCSRSSTASCRRPRRGRSARRRRGRRRTSCSRRTSSRPSSSATRASRRPCAT